MKTLKFFGMALVAVMMCVNFSSCSSDDENVLDNSSQSPKEYIVSLGMIGEIIDVQETPFTRAAPNDLYGIQVYSCSTKEEGATYEPYAYGLFDDVSGLNIKLLEGYKYQFKATMIVNGKNRISYTTDGYSSPFFGFILTSFSYSTQKQINSIGLGRSNILDSDGQYLNCYDRPNVERYYGEYTDYLPSENGSVKIDMGRVSCKVKVVATGKFTEGSVKVTMEKSPDLLVVYNEDKKNDHFEEEVYTFSNVAAASKDKKYAETVKTSFYWIKADGSEIPLKTNHEFTFKRNKQTTITIKVDDAKENGVAVEATDEEISLGDNYTIENGEVIDTSVSPEL